MDNSLLIAIAVIVALIAIFLVIRAMAGPKAVGTTPEPSRADDGLGSAAAAAIEDVAGPLFGVDANPDLAGPADDLTAIKGLGPKASAQLNDLGITRYTHLAALDDDQAAALDARMDSFKGRLARDKWIEQAGHLASGDTTGFEAKFGKLGN